MNMMSLRVMVNKKYLQGMYKLIIDDDTLLIKLLCSTKHSINVLSCLSRWINHPSYGAAGSFDNDFAIIKLSSPVVFSDRVSPVCLPSSSTNYDSRVATVTGWGRLVSGGSQPDILQKVLLTFSPLY